VKRATEHHLKVVLWMLIGNGSKSNRRTLHTEVSACYLENDVAYRWPACCGTLQEITPIHCSGRARSRAFPATILAPDYPARPGALQVTNALFHSVHSGRRLVHYYPTSTHHAWVGRPTPTRLPCRAVQLQHGT